MCSPERWRRVAVACSLALVTACGDRPPPAARAAAERIVGDDASAAGESLAERLAEGDPPPRSVVEAVSAALLEARDRVTGQAVNEEAGFFVETLPTVVEDELRSAGDEWPEVLLAGIVHAYGTPRPVMVRTRSSDDEKYLAAAVRLRSRSTTRIDDELLEIVADGSLWLPARIRAVVALCRPASVGSREGLVSIALDRRQPTDLRMAILARVRRFGPQAPESLEPVVWDPTGSVSIHGALVLAAGRRPVAPSVVLDWLRSLAQAKSGIRIELKLSTPDAAIGMCADDDAVRNAAESARELLDRRPFSPGDDAGREQQVFRTLLAAVEAHVAAHPEILDTPFERELAASVARGQVRLDAAAADPAAVRAADPSSLDVLAALEAMSDDPRAPSAWPLQHAEKLAVEVRRLLDGRREPAVVADACRSILSGSAGPARFVGLLGIAVTPGEAMGMGCGDAAVTAALALSVCDSLDVRATPRMGATGFVVDVGGGNDVATLELGAWSRLRTEAAQRSAIEWYALPSAAVRDPTPAPRQQLLARLLVSVARVRAADSPFYRRGLPEAAARVAGRAAEIDPGSVLARLTLARLTARLGDGHEDDARALLSGARSMRAFSLEERLEEARALQALGDDDEAREILDELAKKAPPRPFSDWISVATAAQSGGSDPPR